MWWDPLHCSNPVKKGDSIRAIDFVLRSDDCSSLPSIPGYRDLSPFYVSDWDSIVYVNCSLPMDNPHYISTAPCISGLPGMYVYAMMGSRTLYDLNTSCMLAMKVYASIVGGSGISYPPSNYSGIYGILMIGGHERVGDGRRRWGQSNQVFNLRETGCIRYQEKKKTLSLSQSRLSLVMMMGGKEESSHKRKRGKRTNREETSYIWRGSLAVDKEQKNGRGLQKPNEFKTEKPAVEQNAFSSASVEASDVGQQMSSKKSLMDAVKPKNRRKR